jgi:hypothetical protein
MFYAETIGWPTILRRVREYRDAFGDYWNPAALIERLAASGGSIYAERAGGR